MDLQASITFLIVAALTGTILIVLIVIPLLYPGIYSGLCFNGEKFAWIWFALPLVICLWYYVILKEGNFDLTGKNGHFPLIVTCFIFGVTVSTILCWLYTVSYKDAEKFFGVSALSGFFSLASLSVASVLVRGLPEHDAYVTLIVILVFNCIMIHYSSSPGESRFGLPLLYVLGIIMFSSVCCVPVRRNYVHPENGDELI